MTSAAVQCYKATLAVTTGLSAPFNNLAIIYKQQVVCEVNLVWRNVLTSDLCGRCMEVFRQLAICCLHSFVYLSCNVMVSTGHW